MFEEKPKPGDYDLGSLESRVAARALLDAKPVDDQQDRVRVVVKCIGKPVTLEMSTCLRYQLAPSEGTGKGLLVEMVDLDGAHPTETQSERLEQWIRRIPIDGQTYKFTEVGNC